MVSTPNGPGGLFERIEKEPEETCIYKRLLLDYTYGLERIYTRQEIEKAKASPMKQTLHYNYHDPGLTNTHCVKVDYGFMSLQVYPRLVGRKNAWTCSDGY